MTDETLHKQDSSMEEKKEHYLEQVLSRANLPKEPAAIFDVGSVEELAAEGVIQEETAQAYVQSIGVIDDLLADTELLENVKYWTRLKFKISREMTTHSAALGSATALCDALFYFKGIGTPTMQMLMAAGAVTCGLIAKVSYRKQKANEVVPVLNYKFKEGVSPADVKDETIELLEEHTRKVLKRGDEILEQIAHYDREEKNTMYREAPKIPSVESQYNRDLITENIHLLRDRLSAYSDTSEENLE